MISENITTLNNEFLQKFKESTLGPIPIEIYHLVVNSIKELKVIESELGIDNEIYHASANNVVNFSGNILWKFIETLPIGSHSILTIKVEGLPIGNSILDVVSETFNILNSIKVDENVRSMFMMRYAAFKALNDQMQPKQESSGCYIATMTYGSYNHPQVLILRQFRDNYLSTTFLGRYFIKIYYIFSPKFVKIFKGNKFVIKLSRLFLDFLIKKIKYKNY